MNTEKLFKTGGEFKIAVIYFLFMAVFVIAIVIGNSIQTDGGRVNVSNVYFKNYNGKHLRAKLFKPVDANNNQPFPGIVFIHGYQNNRESGDAYNIEMARRGFVVLGLDAIGRGNSDVPYDLNHPKFDATFGTRSAMKYLKQLPYVKSESVGVMGHSMGAKFAYQVALKDPSIKAVIIIGSAYDVNATTTAPKNMLMIIGELDEFRDFFTHTKDIITEWMVSESTRNAFPVVNPVFDQTYGDFDLGTARKVFLPYISHIQESHNQACISEAVDWMVKALKPPQHFALNSKDQIWQVKEAMTLLAMLACFGSTLPLVLLLLRLNFFKRVRRPLTNDYKCSTGTYIKGVTVNGILMWLYLPLIMTLFAVHKFLVPIDSVFPMLLVDAIVWWFFWINVAGLFLFRSWYKKQAKLKKVNLLDLGISFQKRQFTLKWPVLLKTALLALLLFGYLYACEILSEIYFMIDFRFIYPLVNDLTYYRLGMFFLYFPFILFGFFALTIFIHGQLRRAQKSTWLKTYLFWTGSNIFALITPLVLFLLIQYIPLLTTGFILFEGPGGVFVVFILELFFIMLTLSIVITLSTWFYQVTGRIYLSVFMNALIVTWLFASSQVVAPIP